MTQGPPVVPGYQPPEPFSAGPVGSPPTTPTEQVSDLAPTQRRGWLIPLLASWAVLATAAAVFFAVGGMDRFRPSSSAGGVPAASSPSSTPLQQANQNCGLIGELSDGDHTLYLDGSGHDSGSGGVSAADFACVLVGLGAPTYVVEQMNQTRALDGQQTATWGAFEARWTYHPDAGLNLIIHQK